jgi:hypothetical protein
MNKIKVAKKDVKKFKEIIEDFTNWMKDYQSLDQFKIYAKNKTN